MLFMAAQTSYGPYYICPPKAHWSHHENKIPYFRDHTAIEAIEERYNDIEESEIQKKRETLSTDGYEKPIGNITLIHM